MQSVGDLKPHCKYRFVTINSWYCFFENYIGLKTNGLFGYMTQESTQKNLICIKKNFRLAKLSQLNRKQNKTV